MHFVHQGIGGIKVLSQQIIVLMKTCDTDIRV